jgi:hypothetical protein
MCLRGVLVRLHESFGYDYGGELKGDKMVLESIPPTWGHLRRRRKGALVTMAGSTLSSTANERTATTGGAVTEQCPLDMEIALLHDTAADFQKRET